MSDQTPNPQGDTGSQGESPQTSGVDEGRLFAFLAYLLSIVGVIIVLLAKKEDRFAVYHAKQSLVLFIGYVVAGIVAWLPIPIVGGLISFVLYLGLFVLWIMGIVYSLTGQQKPLPVIGQFADKFTF